MADNNLTNIAAAQAAASLAAQAAQQEYLRMRLYLLEIPEMQQKSLVEQDNIAFQWAQFAWQTGFQTATLTGKLPAGGLGIPLPNISQIRALTGSTAPAGSFAGGGSGGGQVSFNGQTYTFGGTGAGGAGGAAPSWDSVEQAIAAAGLSGVGQGINMDALDQGGFDQWLQAFQAQGGGLNDPRLAPILQAAQAVGGTASAATPAQGESINRAALGAAIAQSGLGSYSPVEWTNNLNPAEWETMRNNLISQVGEADPRVQQLIAAAQAAGYTTYVPGQPNGYAAPVAPGASNWPGATVNPFGPVSTSGAPGSTTDLQLPGLAPGEVPTLEYIKLMADLTGQLAGRPTLAAQTLTGNVGGVPSLEAQQLAGYITPVLNWRNVPEPGWYDQYGNAIQLASAGASQATPPYSMLPTLQREQIMSELSGYMYGNGAPTLAREAEYNQRAVQLMQLAASLQADPFRAMITLGQTPQGLVDVMNAAAGQMQLPGYSAGPAGTPRTLGQFAGDFQSMLPPGSVVESPARPWEFEALGGRQPTQTSPAGTPAPMSAYNYEVNPNGTLNQYPPGTYAPTNRAQVSSAAPMSYSQAIRAAMASTPYVAPSQISPQAYNDMQPTQRDMLMKSYQLYGLDPAMAEAAYKSSLPQYALQDPTGHVLVENR